MINFIYLAHSAIRFRSQAVFSILSLLEYVGSSDLEFRVVVYTDKPEYFERLCVETILVDDDKLSAWKGPQQFVHRTKICVMMDAAKKFEGRLMFLDSDNCLFNDPTPMLIDWNPGTVIMDKLEYVLQDPADLVGRKYKRFFRKQNEFAGYLVAMSQPCWNSGIIGLPEEAKKRLPDILRVCDEMHGAFQKHLSEQMAFSIVLAKHFKIFPFNQYTYHWFGHGKAVNEILAKALINYPTDGLNELVSAVSEVKVEVLKAPLNKDKLPWYKRWLRT
jgi:hypothetical protein